MSINFFQNNPTLILELHWDFNVNRLHNDMIYDSNYITQVRGNGFCFSTFAPEELVFNFIIARFRSFMGLLRLDL